MKYKLTKAFYLKCIFILGVLLLAYRTNQSFIQTTLSDNALSFQESLTLILKEVIGISNSTKTESLELGTISNFAEPGNMTPYEVDEQIRNSENYLIAQDKAEAFNQSIDLYALNEAFLHKTNYMRSHLVWEPLLIGYQLEEGVNKRVKELAENQYLSSYTFEGLDFRAHFDHISDPQYRLGENLYELFISAGDVHLTTWQNPKILADYLFDVFKEAISLNNYDVYRSQYIAIRAEPTDYNINESPYIRLVVSLVSDIMEE